MRLKYIIAGLTVIGTALGIYVSLTQIFYKTKYYVKFPNPYMAWAGILSQPRFVPLPEYCSAPNGTELEILSDPRTLPGSASYFREVKALDGPCKNFRGWIAVQSIEQKAN